MIWFLIKKGHFSSLSADNFLSPNMTFGIMYNLRKYCVLIWLVLTYSDWLHSELLLIHAKKKLISVGIKTIELHLGFCNIYISIGFYGNRPSIVLNGSWVLTELDLSSCFASCRPQFYWCPPIFKKRLSGCNIKLTTLAHVTCFASKPKYE